MAFPDDFTPISPTPGSPATTALGASTPKHSEIHTQIVDAIDDIHDHALTVETRLDAAGAHESASAPHSGHATPASVAAAIADAIGSIDFQVVDYVPKVLASFAASTTAARTSNVVTVTCSHGLPATVLDGFSIYYPGSPSLVAGWYTGLTRVDATTLTFSATGANFSSESVNAGAVFTSEIAMASAIAPAYSLSVGDCITARFYRGSNNPAASKTYRLKVGASSFPFINSSTTSLCGPAEMRAHVATSTALLGPSQLMNVGATTVSRTSFDISADNDLQLSGQIDTAGVWLLMACAKFGVD